MQLEGGHTLETAAEGAGEADIQDNDFQPAEVPPSPLPPSPFPGLEPH